jgi:glycosyltransferase involved in cell wall biosynthesis
MSLASQPGFRVAVHGLPHFCQRLSALLHGPEWHVPYRSPFHPFGLAARLVDLARCDLAYSWTGRISMGKFLHVARTLGKEKIVMLWCGSDALFAKAELSQGKRDPWVVRRTHWAVSPWLAQEVRDLGVDCEYVQVSFVDPVEPQPLPADFSVLAYAPSLAKAHLYGLDLVLKAAEQLPAIPFTVIGLQDGHIPGCPPNVRVFTRRDPAVFFRQSTVLLRPVRHDGLSFMVLEALAHGRHVLYSCPMAGCTQVTSAQEICAELVRLRDLHSSHQLHVNECGRQIIAKDYSAEVVRARLLNRWRSILLQDEHLLHPQTSTL